jgi:cytochrome c2
MRTILLLMLLAPAALLLAAWAAAPPGRADDPISLAVDAARPALARAGAWYRAGPADARPDWEGASHQVLGGNAARAARVMGRKGCGTCHVIPGLPRAHGTVGPSLEGFARRAYVAGILPNRPGTLIDWLMHPAAHAPDTAMPNLGLTEAQARDIAAYLYTLS